MGQSGDPAGNDQRVDPVHQRPIWISHPVLAIGLFAAQEIKMIKGPLFVDHPYKLEREIIALSEKADLHRVQLDHDPSD